MSIYRLIVFVFSLLMFPALFPMEFRIDSMVKRDDLGTESCAVVMFGAYVKLLHSNKRYYAHAERSWPYPHNILAGPGTINGEILVPEVGKSNFRLLFDPGFAHVLFGGFQFAPSSPLVQSFPLRYFHSRESVAFPLKIRVRLQTLLPSFVIGPERGVQSGKLPPLKVKLPAM